MPEYLIEVQGGPPIYFEIEAPPGLKVPIYLETALGAPVPGKTITGSQIQVSKSGDAFVDGEGSVAEISNGAYVYTASTPEAATESFLLLHVLVDGALRFVYSWDMGYQVFVNEPVARARRLPIYLVDSSNDPVSGLDLSDPDVASCQVSINGSAFADTVAKPVEITPDVGAGCYYLELDTAEVAELGEGTLKIVGDDFEEYVYAFKIVNQNTSGISFAQLISMTQPPIARWTPVVAVVQANSTNIYVNLVMNQLSLLIYDPAVGFTSNFRERSLVSTDGDILTFVILPNGGWWTSQIRMKFISGSEITPP